MNVEVQVSIGGSREAIWDVITNIENASETISGIEKVEILEQPAAGLVGLKWRETRTLFGKTATEEMWITDSADYNFYQTRAESHGFVYFNKISISEHDGRSSLTMCHDSQPQGFVAKLLSVPMGLVFRGAIKKALLQDLNDIKAAVEQQ